MKLVQRLLVVVTALFVCATNGLAQEKRFSDLVGKVTVGDVQNSPSIRVPYIFWGADVATFYANGNTKTQGGSIYNKLGLNIELTAGDDFVQQVRDYMSGKSPFLRGTMGMIGDASEIANSDPRTKPVVLFQLSWSKGDHLVVKSGIKTVTDLRGKTIALQEGGPHPKLLDDILRAAGLTWNDIKVIYTKDLTGTDDSPASLFKRRQDVDGAFVVTPDMIGLTGGLQNVGSGAEGTVKGARVAASTSELSRSIADVYVCRQDWYNAHQDWALKFTAGYFKASEDVMEMQTAYNSKGSKNYLNVLRLAQDIYGKKLLPTIEEDAAGLVSDAVFSGYPGNVVFFTEANNPVGFEAQTNEVLDLSFSRGHTKVRGGLASAKLDYQSTAFIGYLRETNVVRKDRFRGEALQEEIEALTNQGALDGNTLLSFSVQFDSGETNFNLGLYAQEFQRVVSVLSKAGNAIIVVRGHSDPTKTLADFVKAGVSKGVLKQSGTPGNYTYYFDGKPISLADTRSIIKCIEDGGVDNAPNGINPRDTMSYAMTISRQRADTVVASIIQFAKEKGLKLDASQVQPSGVGVKEPLIAKPRNMGEANQNMRVEFRLIRVTAEPTKQGDFDF